MTLAVRPLVPGDYAELRPLLSGYAFAPYSYYPGIDGERLVSYLMSEMNDGMRDPDTRFWVTYAGHDPIGLTSSTFLKWDTEQLGVRTARMGRMVLSRDSVASSSAVSALLGRIYQDCAEREIGCLTARLNSNEVSLVHRLEDDGFNVMDGIITFSYDLRKTEIPDRRVDLAVRLSNEADSQRLERIALTSFTHDRFHSDPRISPEVADRIYGNWVRNSVQGVNADAVVVGEMDGRPVGFVTCKVDERSGPVLGLCVGTVVLVAVDASVRGRGVASALTGESLKWFKTRGVEMVEVGTQLRNIPASRLYEGIGFRLVASSLSLRKWTG